MDTGKHIWHVQAPHAPALAPKSKSYYSLLYANNSFRCNSLRAVWRLLVLIHRKHDYDIRATHAILLHQLMAQKHSHLATEHAFPRKHVVSTGDLASAGCL